MSILLGTSSVAFAAFWIWLAVRIINRGERWAKWTALGLAVATASLAVWWWTRPQEGRTFDPIDMPADFPSGN